MTTWTLDPSHSSIDFKVRHLGIASVKGKFTRFTGAARLEGARLAGVEATLEAASLSTNDERRDGHLRSADFFAVDEHPEIRFRSTEIESLGGPAYRVTGDLALHGETRPVTFDVTLGEPMRDPFGLTRTAAHVQGKLNRTHWGLRWNQVLETGGFLVGEDVIFDFDVQAVLQEAKEAQPA